MKHKNSGLSTELIRQIGHRKEIQRLTFRALALRQSVFGEIDASKPYPRM